MHVLSENEAYVEKYGIAYNLPFRGGGGAITVSKFLNRFILTKDIIKYLFPTSRY